MYDARRRRLPPSELKEKRKKANRVAVGIGLVCLLVLFVVGIWASRQDWFLIKDIRVSGTSVLSSERVAEVVDESIEGYYFKTVPKRNTFFLSKGAMKRHLFTTFSRIENVTFDREGKNELAVIVKEFEPHALWCGANRPLLATDDSETCYFLDNQGYIFASAPTFSGSAYFKYYGDLGVSEPLRANVFKPNELYEAELLILQLTELDLQPIYLEKTNEGDYRVMLRAGYSILFAPQSPLLEQVLYLEALLSSEGFNSDRDTSPTPLEYIDVRFGNKLYYRFVQTGEEKEEEKMIEQELPAEEVESDVLGE
ncbi:MAG: hypothetical protein WDZ88_00145 [Candidatus Paceibacterota bacterium]